MEYVGNKSPLATSPKATQHCTYRGFKVKKNGRAPEKWQRVESEIMDPARRKRGPRTAAWREMIRVRSMPCPLRFALAGYVYRGHNRAVALLPLFEKDGDFAALLRVVPTIGIWCLGRQVTSGFTTESPSAVARVPRAWLAQTNSIG
jgi:hypothetical protein